MKKGCHLSEETKKKMSESRKGKCISEEVKKKRNEAYNSGMKGKHHSEETKRKLRDANRGKCLSEEHKQKIGNALKGKHFSEEIKRNMSELRKGKNSPWWGKHLSEETKRKMSDAHKGKNKGRHHSEETKRKISMAHRGEKSYLWKGGISFEPYSVDWTKTLKRSIRERDHYFCQICWDYGAEVHHIDYDKKNCNPTNLVTLCKCCHTKTNHDRKKWQRIFM